MDTIANPDVVVVGAGPVGLVAAAELVRRGVTVRIFDRLAEPTDQSRAIAVHARSLDMCHRMGIADSLMSTGIKATGMQLYAGHDKLLRIRFDEVDSAFPYSLVTAQTETERVLDDHLTGLGVTVERGVELTGLAQDDEGVHLTLRGADGATEQCTTAWVIGADGGHSTVRHLVGAKLAGSFQGERFLLGDVDAEHDLDVDSMHTFFSAEGPVLVFPMRDGRTRVMAEIHEAPGTPLNLNPDMTELQAVIDRRIGGVRLLRPHWMTTFEIHHALVPAYRWNRVFLVGDACHIHSPAGGQGMNTGMQDAFNLAWKLAAAVKGEAGDTLLDSYHAERYPVAEQMITFTDRLTRAGTLSGVPQRVRNIAIRTLSHFEPVRRYMADTAEEVNVNYRNSPIAVGKPPKGAKVAAGEHLPHIADNAVQKQLDGLCVDPGHSVITIAARQVAPASVGGQVQVLVTGHDTPVAGYDTVIADPSGLVADRLGLAGGGRIVVRPDGYLGAVTTLDDPRPITDYFATIAG